MQTLPLFLNNKWVNSDRSIEVIDPATTEPFARVATVQRDQVRQALEDAQAALPAWRDMAAIKRGQFLYAIADQMEKRADEIAKTITRENGKPLAQSKGELGMSLDHLRWFAEQAKRAYGRIIPHQVEGKRHWTIKSPVGVVGAIAPWNFPLVLALRKAAPAMAAGCPVVLKPASATPLSTLILAQCVEAAGVPAGVFQVVLGNAAQIAAEMLENPICRKISFTGSTQVGQKLIVGAAETITKLSLELGGHAPAIVFDDADLETAVQGVIVAKFRNTGQSCIAANRIYVQRSIHDDFLDRLLEHTRALKIGNGLEDGVEIGPLINRDGLDTAIRHIEDAVSNGAKVMCGGKRWGGRGNFLEPTILTNVPDHACCMIEETFAPVAPVCPFDDEAEVIERANRTQYGLAAFAFSRDLSRTIRLAEALEAGTIAINEGSPSTSQCPFGGIKQSGWGRELGQEGLDAYLETKHIAIGAVNT